MELPGSGDPKGPWTDGRFGRADMEQLSGRGPGVQVGQFLILLAIIVGLILAGPA